VQHVARHAHRLIRWLGGVAAVLILIAAAGIWRLVQGPIEFDWLIPYVQEAFERSGTRLGISVSGVRIAVDPTTRQLDLQLENVRLSLPDGEALANFPEMSTSFSLGALLRGRITPTQLVLERPVLRLTRDETGALAYRIGATDVAASNIGLGNLEDIFAPSRPDAAWDQLRQVAIRDASVVIDDRLTGQVWQANRVAGTLQRSEQGVDGELALAVVLGANAPELHATYHYEAASKKLALELAVDGLDPTALAPLSPGLAPLAHTQFPVSGTLAMRLDLAVGKAEGARLDLSLGEGRLETDLLADGGVALARGELHANYAPKTAELRLEKLALNLHGGTRLIVDGHLDGVAPAAVAGGLPWPGDLAGGLGITLSHVPAAKLDTLWPQGVSPGGRRWVAANVSDGMLDEMSVQLALKIDAAAQSAVVSGARGTMRYHDLTINYFNGLPLAHKVSGTATLEDRRLDFTVAGGALKSLKATGGTLSITDLGSPMEWLTVDVTMTGPLQDALDAIDAKPLNYAHEAGIDPAQVGGRIETQLHFKFPLLADLKLEAVDYGAKATLAGVSVAKIAMARGLSDGNFTLELGHAGVHLQGDGRFDGTPTTLDANLFFHPKSGPRARYRIGLTLDDEARRRLDWDLVPERLSGPVGVDLTYTVLDGTRAQADATLDLRGTSLAIAEAGWKKPPGVAGTAMLIADLDNESVARLPQIEVRAAGLDARFALALSADRKRVDRVQIRRLVVADTDVSGVISRRPAGGWHADIHGARLDLSHEIKRAVADDTPDSAPPLLIDARIDQLTLGPGRDVRDVSAQLLRERGAWQTMRIDARYPNGDLLALRIAGEGGDRRLHFESNDLGASLKLLGIAGNVIGGQVTVEGTVSEVAGRQLVRAHLEGTDYSLERAPALARLLSLPSLEGLASTLSGSGIPFTALRADFTYSNGRVGIDRLIAYGGALGITANGWFDPAHDRLDVAGTLAPANILNSLLGHVPVIGSLLMGGEGQSLFAASFRLDGSSDKPDATVNPLSGLTPGLLRHLFDPFLGSPSSGPPQEAAH